MRLAALAATAIIAASAPGFSAKPTGEWAVPGNLAHLRIANCGGRLWGVISWEKQPGIDRHNPNPAKRGRPMLGVPILLGMKRAEPNRWDGNIYNANDGQIYSAHIKLASANVLHVEGCLLGFLCGGQDWTRIKDPAADPHQFTAVSKQSICANAESHSAER